MPHIIHLTYIVDDETRERVKPAHRAYLQPFYDAGLLLVSGPRTDLTGGVIVTADIDATTVAELIDNDPFNTEGVATYEAIEFGIGNVRAGLFD